MIRVYRHAVARLQVGRHCLAQRGDAIGGRVAVMAIPQRLDPGLDDMVWRAEIRLADAQIDDVPALCRQFLRSGEHFKGGFGAEAVNRGSKLKHGPVSRDREAMFGS